jgi:hypothetical protein
MMFPEMLLEELEKQAFDRENPEPAPEGPGSKPGGALELADGMQRLAAVLEGAKKDEDVLDSSLKDAILEPSGSDKKRLVRQNIANQLRAQGLIG